MSKNNNNPFSPSVYEPGKEFFFKEGKTIKNKIFRIIFALLTIILVVGAYFWQKNQADLQNSQRAVVAQIPPDAENVFANDISGVSTAVETQGQNAGGNGDVEKRQTDAAFSKSEKYQIREISFGGSPEILSGETESMPLAVTDVRSEMLSSRDGSQSNLLINWKTSKMAVSDVTYDKGGVSKKLSESGFGYSHALLLSDLDQSQRYTFVITAIDRWGNQSSSENFSVFTGEKTASIIDVITSQFQDIFSWAVRK